jgi:hypothetical protein
VADAAAEQAGQAEQVVQRFERILAGRTAAGKGSRQVAATG